MYVLFCIRIVSYCVLFPWLWSQHFVTLNFWVHALALHTRYSCSLAAWTHHRLDYAPCFTVPIASLCPLLDYIPCLITPQLHYPPAWLCPLLDYALCLIILPASLCPLLDYAPCLIMSLLHYALAWLCSLLHYAPCFIMPSAWTGQIDQTIWNNWPSTRDDCGEGWGGCCSQSFRADQKSALTFFFFYDACKPIWCIDLAIGKGSHMVLIQRSLLGFLPNLQVSHRNLFSIWYKCSIMAVRSSNFYIVVALISLRLWAY